MDTSIQILLQRTKERRQMISKMMEENDTSPKRNRAQLLEDENDENSMPTSKYNSEDSPPKRQKIYEKDYEAKPGRSTTSVLGEKSHWENSRSVKREYTNENSESVSKPLLTSTTPTKTSCTLGVKSPAAPAARKTRLAALAANINNWEDDSGHGHTPTRMAETTEKKTWQPPKAEPGPPKPSRTFESNGVPSKPTRTFEFEKSPTKSPHTKRFVSPSRTAAEDALSPCKANTKKEVSSLTVTLGSNPTRATAVTSNSNKPAASPEKKAYSHISRDSPVKGSPNEPTNKPIQERMSQWRQKTEANEPTKTPVASRIGSWQSKVNSVEASEKMQTPGKPTFKVPASKTPNKVAHMALKAAQLEDDPLNMSINSRKNTWETRIKQSEIEVQEHVQSLRTPGRKSPAKLTITDHQTTVSGTAKSPVKAMAKSPVNTNLGKSPRKYQAPQPPSASPTKKYQAPQPPKVVSPSKVSASTAGIHKKLESLVQSQWQSNNIVEETKQQRQAELDMLQNRWKDGMLKETDDRPNPSLSANPDLAKSVPAPPPPPPTTEQRPGASTADRTRPKTPNARREQTRDKLRNDFEDKLKAMGFDVESTADSGKVAKVDLTPYRGSDMKEETAEEQHNRMAKPRKLAVMQESEIHTVVYDHTKKVKVGASTTPKVPTTPGGTSIYNLIKKNAGATPKPYEASPYTKQPAKVSSTDDSFDDSFESHTEDDRRYESQSSLVSESASQYSESQTESQTDTVSQTDDYSYEDDENSYESEEDGIAADVSDLLEEAMDSDLESSVPAPEYRPQRTESNSSGSNKRPRPVSQPDTYYFNHQDVCMPPEKKVTFSSVVDSTSSARSASSRTSSASSAVSSSESEREQAISLDDYRRQQKKTMRQTKAPVPTPRMTIVRQPEHEPRERQQQRQEIVPDEKSTRHKIDELQMLVNQEQTVILQTSNALNQCCGQNSLFAGSQEAVECHRLLLVACKRREAYLNEIHTLKSRQSHPSGGPKGSLTMSDIRIPLKQEFMSKIGGPNDTTQHFFICLVRHNNHLVFTQMVSTHDAMVRGSLEFPNLIKLNDIKQDFRVTMEIYGMAITRDLTQQTPKKKKGLTPKKAKAKSFQSPGGPTAVRSTNFVEVACLQLTARALNKTHFSLDRVPFSSPLQGTIHVRLRCVIENNVEERGFLTMFDDVSGFGAWHRRWCVLKNHTLCYWRYPDDEFTKEPIDGIDLKFCITDSVGLLPRDVCARPNTFELLTVRRPGRNERDTLVSRTYNTMTTTKHWISADTKEDREVWSGKLNEDLVNLRTWHADALRPIKKQEIVKEYNPYCNKV